MELVLLHTILKSDVSRSGRVKVKIAMVGRPAAEFWLSARQFQKLEDCFLRTGNDYSDKNCQVVAVLDGDRFVWPGCHNGRRSDVPFLADRFGVEIPEDIARDIAVVAAPAVVEIPDDLRD